MLTQEKMPDTFTWTTQWGTFNGDERALTPEQIKLCSLRDVPPPPPQDLFVAFTQPIYGQITAKIKKNFTGNVDPSPLKYVMHRLLLAIFS